MARWDQADYLAPRDKLATGLLTTQSFPKIVIVIFLATFEE